MLLLGGWAGAHADPRRRKAAGSAEGVPPAASLRQGLEGYRCAGKQHCRGTGTCTCSMRPTRMLRSPARRPAAAAPCAWGTQCAPGTGSSLHGGVSLAGRLPAGLSCSRTRAARRCCGPPAGSLQRQAQPRHHPCRQPGSAARGLTLRESTRHAARAAAPLALAWRALLW